jgi:hypothetical protein
MLKAKLRFERRPLPKEWVIDDAGTKYEVVSAGLKFICCKRPSGAKQLINMHSLQPCKAPRRDEVTTA